MTDRDTFAAAALTGLLSLNCEGPDQQLPTELCERAFRWADAMLRERERTNHDAVPEARDDGSTLGNPVPPVPVTGNTQEPVAWAVHWPSVQSRRPVLVHADEKPSEFWRPMPRCVALYECPQPALTDEERADLEFAIDYLPADLAATLGNLLERTK